MSKFNVLMIFLDGVRKDRVELFDELVSLTKKGVYFSEMIISAPYTVASMFSMFSGLYPGKNGVDAYYNMFRFKKDSCKTLTQYLKEQGYYTAMDVGVDGIIPNQGFDQIGFWDEFKYKEDLAERHKNIIRRFANKKPFFLLCRYDRVHTSTILNVGKKYDDFSKEYFNNLEENKKNYNGYVKNAALYAKDVFDEIESLGLLKDTIVILFSDHGISNGEKIGEKMYGCYLYDYTTKVFSMFFIPGKKGQEIKKQIRSIDVMPTILDLLGIPLDKNFYSLQGKSVVPLIEGVEKEDRVAFSETGGLKGPWPSPKKHNVKAVRYKGWKLIHNEKPDTWELYNLSEDLGESKNIYGKGLEMEKKLKEKLVEIECENNQGMEDYDDLKI